MLLGYTRNLINYVPDFYGQPALTLIHTLIPNHWMPYTALSKAKKWNRLQVFQVTIITGLAHTLSTVIVGILAGLISYRLSAKYGLIAGTIAPAILAGVGIISLRLKSWALIFIRVK